MQELGKNKRLKRIFSDSSGKIVIVPLDDSLLAGPINGLEKLETKTQKIVEAGPNAIIAFQGLLRNYHEILCNVPAILNLTASTTTSSHTKKTLISNVETALQLNADAVAVHVNISSRYETKMLRILGNTLYRCSQFGVPIMGIMYPRSENPDGTDNNYLDLKEREPASYARLVCHAVRVAADLGVDFIKTQFTGSSDSFQQVIDAANRIPVVIAGGPQIPVPRLLRIAEQACAAGAAGVCFGRNVFSRSNPGPLINALKQIVLKNRKANEFAEDCALINLI
jgi:DhnA family fructose-bisphosphate aldolase class Ia